MALSGSYPLTSVLKGDGLSLRVFFYCMNYSPEPTGVGRYTGDIGSYLAGRGVAVEVVTAAPHYPGWKVFDSFRNRYSTGSIGGVTLSRCPLLLKSGMGGIWRLLAPLTFAITSAPVAFWRILRMRPAVVFCVEPTLFVAPVALLAAKLVGARTLLHVQDFEIDAAFAVGHVSPKRWLMSLASLFERLCWRGVDHFVTISGRMAEQIECKGIAGGRVSIVRNWVDLAHIKPAARSRSYRAELGLADDAFVVLYSGNLGPKQGLDVVIEAARRLKDLSNVTFVIAGEGPSRMSLVAAAAGLGNVRFLPLQPYERLGDFLGLCDLHVLPQLAAAGDLVLPSKLGGMLASGRPIIVMAEKDTELGRFLDGAAAVITPEDPDALVASIRAHLVDDPDGGSERRLALANELSRDAAMARFEEILTTLAKGGPAHAVP
ncbi:MAG: WcaI family glycosyltransferase [Rhodopseudomonas sp.]|nr:WcaI family glycosyltransferase [Rhodopseudomonas sp.]